MAEDMDHMACVLGRYRDALGVVGFTREEAMRLCLGWQDAFMLSQDAHEPADDDDASPHLFIEPIGG